MDTPDGSEDAPLDADLEWRDYVALVLALAQTVLLPFLLVVLALFVLSVLALVFL